MLLTVLTVLEFVVLWSLVLSWKQLVCSKLRRLRRTPISLKDEGEVSDQAHVLVLTS